MKATRFPTVVASIHHGSSPFVACADGVHEPKIESIAGRATWAADLALGGGW